MCKEGRHLREQSNDLLRFLDLVRPNEVLGVLRIEEPILPIQHPCLRHALKRADRISSALQDARLEHRQFRERGGVHFGLCEESERLGLVTECRVVLGEEVESPEVGGRGLDFLVVVVLGGGGCEGGGGGEGVEERGREVADDVAFFGVRVEGFEVGEDGGNALGEGGGEVGRGFGAEGGGGDEVKGEAADREGAGVLRRQGIEDSDGGGATFLGCCLCNVA